MIILFNRSKGRKNITFQQMGYILQLLHKEYFWCEWIRIYHKNMKYTGSI